MSLHSTHQEFKSVFDTVVEFLNSNNIEFKVSHSSTDFGKSLYIVTMKDNVDVIKIRVSGHSVTNAHRILSEVLIDLNDTKEVVLTALERVERIFYPSRFVQVDVCLVNSFDNYNGPVEGLKQGDRVKQTFTTKKGATHVVAIRPIVRQVYVRS